MKRQIFMDTAFLIAVIDESDEYHKAAVECYKKLIKEKWKIITTDAVLIELGNGLSQQKWRNTAHKWITQIRKSSNTFDIVTSTKEILNMAVELYGSRPDKDWGLTDCISFIIMQMQKLTNALTTDLHFEQAGFRKLMELD